MDNETKDLDSIKIISVSPCVNLTDEVEQEFTITVDYVLSTTERGEIVIAFNTDSLGLFEFDDEEGRVVVSKGYGRHTFNTTIMPKNWSPEAYFGVKACLSDLNSTVALDNKVLLFIGKKQQTVTFENLRVFRTM